MRFDTLRAFGYSVAIHVIALALVTFSASFDTYLVAPPPKSSVIRAVAVDSKLVEKEVERLRAADDAKRKRDDQVKR